MPFRFLPILLVQLLLSTLAYCQLTATGRGPLISNYKVIENDKGQLVTTFDMYRSDGSVLERIYLGSPYLSFPIWQPGTINVDGKGEDVPCQIAYNLFSDEILCRLPGSDKEILVVPVAFTINGVPFVSTPIRSLGKMARLYYAVFNRGTTKFLVNYRRQYADSFNRSQNPEVRNFDGEYVTLERYFLRIGNADPVEIKLTAESLLRALPDKAPQLKERFRSKNLTKDEVIAALTYYDSLTGDEPKAVNSHSKANNP